MAVDEVKQVRLGRALIKRRIIGVTAVMLAVAGVVRWYHQPRSPDTREARPNGWSTVFESRITPIGALLGKFPSGLTRWIPSDVRAQLVITEIWIDLRHGELLDGLARLRECPCVRRLTIRGRRMTDVELEHLFSMKSLEELHLDDTSVSANGLSRLCEGAELNRLILSGRGIGDSEIRQLRPGDSLRKLELYGSSVSADAVEEFSARYKGVSVSVHETALPIPASGVKTPGVQVSEAPMEGR